MATTADQKSMEEMEQELAAWKQKYYDLQAKVGLDESKEKEPNKLLEGIQVQCHSDPEYVKKLVKTKQILADDIDSFGQNLLIKAAWYGAEDIVNYCINAGFDINDKDGEGKDAIDRAIEAGHYHVEQILLFAKLNIGVGNELKNSADTLNRQIGVNRNILRELALIGTQSKQLFEQTLMELLIRIIEKRLSFSDELFNLCWSIACRQKKDPLQSELWKALKTSCCYVIESKSKRDWFWLRNCVLPSTIWIQNVNIDDTQKPRYAFFEILSWVDEEALRQIQLLESDLKVLADKDAQHWSELTKWTTGSDTKAARQDTIPNGIVSSYTYSQLVASSGTKFNSPKFYDYNQYLSQLVLLAQVVDDEFQKSVQSIFDVNSFTGYGKVAMEPQDTDEKEDNDQLGVVHYSRGPLKLIDRARAKAQNDYYYEAFPTIACVIDINRCSLVFDDITTLLNALQEFTHKVKHFQSGNIIGIARCKNGFIEYIKQTDYADVKLNVLIEGPSNNIIGEVQFLLNRMKAFKDRGHNLYGIQRQREVFEGSAQHILPLLMNEYKQIRVAGSFGDVKALCRLMVINTKSVKQLMEKDEGGCHILHPICMFGLDRAFVFLVQTSTKEELLNYLTSRNLWNMIAIDYAFEKGNAYIIRRIFELPEILKYYENTEYRHELYYWMFAYNHNNEVTDYVVSKMNVKKDDLIAMLKYHAPTPEMKVDRWGHFYDQLYILNECLRKGPITAVKKLMSLVGEDEFIGNIMQVDGWNTTAFESAVRHNATLSVEFVLQTDSKRFKFIADTYKDNDPLLFRLVFILFVYNTDMIDFVLFEKLGVSKEKVAALLTSYKYEYKEDIIQNGTSTPHSYAHHTIAYGSIVNELVTRKSVKQMKNLVSVIGEKAFVECVFYKDDSKKNGVQTAIESKKLEPLEYILSTKEVVERCNDKDGFESVVLTLNECEDVDILKSVVKTLKLDAKKTGKLKLTNKQLLDLL